MTGLIKSGAFVTECEWCLFKIVWISPILQSLVEFVCPSNRCCCVSETKWSQRVRGCGAPCFGGRSTCPSSWEGWTLLWVGMCSKTGYGVVQGADIVSLQQVSMVVLQWVAWVGLVVSVTIINHGTLDECSVLATIPRVQMLKHLWSLVEKHEYWDEEVCVGGIGARAVWTLQWFTE